MEKVVNFERSQTQWASGFVHDKHLASNDGIQFDLYAQSFISLKN